MVVGTPYGDYNLLAADPDKYGLVFSCRQVSDGGVSFSSSIGSIISSNNSISSNNIYNNSIFKS